MTCKHPNCSDISVNEHCYNFTVKTGASWHLVVDDSQLDLQAYGDAAFVIKRAANDLDGAAVLYVDTVNGLQVVGGVAPLDPASGELHVTPTGFEVIIDATVTHWTTDTDMVAEWEFKAVETATGDTHIIASGSITILDGVIDAAPGNIIVPGAGNVQGTYVVNTVADMLALNMVNQGDMVIVLDDPHAAYNGSWVALVDNPSALNDYKHVAQDHDFLPRDGSVPMTGRLQLDTLGLSAGQIDGGDPDWFMRTHPGTGDLYVGSLTGGIVLQAKDGSSVKVVGTHGPFIVLNGYEARMRPDYTETDPLDVTTKGYVDAHALSYQVKAEKGQASGYAPLDANSKVPAQHLPASNASPHHVFATQADMLAGGAVIVLGDMVLVHGDPIAEQNGEYIALQDAPTLLTHLDHLGEHIAAHRHTGDDVDVTIHGTTEVLTVGLTHMGDVMATKLDMNGNAAANILPFKPLTTAEIAALTGNYDVLYLDTHDRLWFVDHAGVHNEMRTAVDEPTSDGLFGREKAGTALHWTPVQGAAQMGDLSKWVTGTDTVTGKLEDLQAQVSKNTHTAGHSSVPTDPDFISTIPVDGAAQGGNFIMVEVKLAVTNPANPGHDVEDGQPHWVRFSDGAHPVPSDATWVWLTDSSSTPVRLWTDAAGKLGAAAITVRSWIDGGFFVQVKKKSDNNYEVVKVQAPIVAMTHAKSLLDDGSVDAHSLPLVSLNATQIAAVKNNAFYLDDSQVLKWKDNTGTIKEVSLT